MPWPPTSSSYSKAIGHIMPFLQSPLQHHNDAAPHSIVSYVCVRAWGGPPTESVPQRYFSWACPGLCSTAVPFCASDVWPTSEYLEYWVVGCPRSEILRDIIRNCKSNFISGLFRWPWESQLTRYIKRLQGYDEADTGPHVNAWVLKYANMCIDDLVSWL